MAILELPDPRSQAFIMITMENPATFQNNRAKGSRARCVPGLPAGSGASSAKRPVDKRGSMASIYVSMAYIEKPVFDRGLKKGSAELLILSLVERRPRHGYEISKLIEERSDGVLKFNVASFYPLLYRLEKRGFLEGRWVEKAGQRRRRYYRVTALGKKVLKEQRSTWREFVNAINRVTGAEHA